VCSSDLWQRLRRCRFSYRIRASPAVRSRQDFIRSSRPVVEMPAFWPALKVVWAPRLEFDNSVKLANMKKQNPALTQPPAADKIEEAVTAASEDNRPEPPPEAAPSVGDATPQPATSSGKKEEAPRKSGKVALLLALLALAGVGFVGWQVWELRQTAEGMRSNVADRLATTDARAS